VVEVSHRLRGPFDLLRCSFLAGGRLRDRMRGSQLAMRRS